MNYLYIPIVATSRNTMLKALNYLLVKYKLYKKSYEGPLMKYLNGEDAIKALAKIHKRLSNAHQAALKLRWTLQRTNYIGQLF
jgi:hypothetical protein